MYICRLQNSNAPYMTGFRFDRVCYSYRSLVYRWNDAWPSWRSFCAWNVPQATLDSRLLILLLWTHAGTCTCKAIQDGNLDFTLTYYMCDRPFVVGGDVTYISLKLSVWTTVYIFEEANEWNEAYQGSKIAISKDLIFWSAFFCPGLEAKLYFYVLGGGGRGKAPLLPTPTPKRCHRQRFTLLFTFPLV